MSATEACMGSVAIVISQSPRTYTHAGSWLPARVARRAAMALSKLSADQHRSIFLLLWDVLEPRVAVDLSSVSHELREPTQALLQHLRAHHEVVAALCRKMGTSCKELREAKSVDCRNKGLSAADLTLLGLLGSELPALKMLHLDEPTASPDGVQRLAEGLGAGALPAVNWLTLQSMHVGDAGASALAAALGRGALPRLKILHLIKVAIGDAGLVALAPALRRLPALEKLMFMFNPFGDEGIAALVPPPPPAGALPPPAGGLLELDFLYLNNTQITDAGCAALVAALDGGALPAIHTIHLDRTPASAEAQAAVQAAVQERMASRVQEAELRRSRAVERLAGLGLTLQEAELRRAARLAGLQEAKLRRAALISGLGALSLS
eukprot:scaffold4944_cov65-Phaeocystis_antarctica.AAC.1